MWKFLEKVWDKILDNLAGLFAVGILALIFGIIGAVAALLSNNPQSVWIIIAIVVLVGLNMYLLVRTFRVNKKSNVGNKNANIWWLRNDIGIAIAAIGEPNSQATKVEIDHYLLKLHHHAEKAKLSGDLIPRLLKVKDEARNYSIGEWTLERRHNISRTLESIRNDIGRYLENNQPDFDPGPNLI